MKTFLTKVLAFFMKEIHDVRRQPRLMLSLIGGPLLVLAAFGATFQSSNPFIRTVLVWPEEGIPGVDRERASDYIGKNFTLVDVISDEDAALRMLDAGEIDVVQIIPQFDPATYSSDSRPEIRVVSRAIDPNAEAWTRSLAIAETNYINRQILSVEAEQAQEKAVDFQAELEDARDVYLVLTDDYTKANIDEAIETTEDLKSELGNLLIVLPPASMAQANLAPELNQVYKDIHILEDDLDELETVLKAEQELLGQQKVETTLEEIDSLEITISTFTEMEAVDIISPVRESYTNLRGSAYPMVIFFAPAVLALLVQQMAVTLASLGLVRERQMGSYEMFRVAPLKFTQMLLGKSLAYITYVVAAGVILTVLLSLLNVPMPADILSYAATLVLLAVSSVGIGFMISAFSKTDSQAIQLTMLLLLLSIFFTGFFMPITGFAWPAWIIAFFIPMTHAIAGFKDVLLVGSFLRSSEWISLMIISVLAFGMVVRMLKKQAQE